MIDTKIALRCVGCAQIIVLTAQALQGVVLAAEHTTQTHAMLMCESCQKAAVGFLKTKAEFIAQEELDRLGRKQ